MKTFINSLFCIPLTIVIGIMFEQQPGVIWQAALTFWPAWFIILYLDNRWAVSLAKQVN